MYIFYSWRFGTTLHLYIMDYKLLKEHLSSVNFSARPALKVFSLNVSQDPNDGLVTSYGDRWHKNRRFSLRLLKDLGMGKSRLTHQIHEEARELVQAFKKCIGDKQKIPPALSMCVLNVISRMLSSKITNFVF